jgi:SAM-dependent methyltransferase
VVCTTCGSLDRHRVMALVTQWMIARAPQSSIILDVAPSTALSELIRESSGLPYLSIDFDPDADGRRPDVCASITQLPLPTGSVGFLLCSHVLEHVADDRSALLEMARVLHPGGATLIQVPRRRGSATEEELALSPEGRVKRYGQADHVRLYGDDFEQRLRMAGLKLVGTSYAKLLPKPLLQTIGVSSDHELWIATTGGDPGAFVDPDAFIRALVASLVSAPPPGAAVADTAVVSELERRLDAAVAEAEAWQSKYEWLRNRPPIRAASAVKRFVSGLTPPFRGRSGT